MFILPVNAIEGHLKIVEVNKVHLSIMDLCCRPGCKSLVDRMTAVAGTEGKYIHDGF